MAVDPPPSKADRLSSTFSIESSKAYHGGNCTGDAIASSEEDKGFRGARLPGSRQALPRSWHAPGPRQPDDWNLSLEGLDARVIKANGTYRIVVAFPDDPDLWDGRLGFARDDPR